MAKWLIYLTALFAWPASTTYAQQPEDLRQQLKQEYENKIRDLEQRLDAVEKQGSQASVAPQVAPQQSTS
jgi:hypothetical protein